MLPEFKLFGQIFFPYAILSGVACGAFYIISKSKTKNYFSNLYYFCLLLSCWLGAKLLFLLTLPSFLSEKMISNQVFWLGGGFVFFGGLIAGLIYSIVYIKVKNKNFKQLNELILPLLVAHGIGRLGCLLAGCCFGIKYTGLFSINGMLPVQLIESVFLFTLAFIFRYKKEKLVVNYLIIYSVFRFLIEYARADKIRGFALGMSTSQIISLMLFLIGIGFLLKQTLYRRQTEL